MKKVVMAVLAVMMFCVSSFAYSNGTFDNVKVTSIHVDKSEGILLQVEGLNHKHGWVSLGKTSQTSAMGMLELALSAKANNFFVNIDIPSSSSYYEEVRSLKLK